MKKITALFIILALFGFTTESGNGLLFKVEYKPETRYNETMEQSSEATVTYSGSDEFLNNLKDKGISNPNTTKKESKTVEIFKTGKLKDSIHFPLTMEFVSTVNSDGKQIIPDGTILYGTGTVGNMPVLDSMFSPGMADETKKMFLKTMTATMSQITFPEKQLNVGDSFAHESPVTIPIAGIKLGMKITTVYTLVSISGGQANFDILQRYSMTLDKYTTEGNGSGSGHIIYDIAHNFYSSFEETGSMHLKMKTDDFNLVVDSKNTFKQTVAFGKNN